MKHLSRDTSLMWRVLQRARTIAVVGASPDPARHSHTVVQYLADEGYDVVPVRPDQAEVAGLITYSNLASVPGAVDVVVVFRTPSAVPAHIDEAAAKSVEVIWLPPGTSSDAADVAARKHGLTVVKEHCIMDVHRRLSQRSGHPEKWGVHLRRRKAVYEDNRIRTEDSGYTPDGGGGHVAGGGSRSVLDEKKMVTGAPSRRSGTMKPRPR